MNAFLENLYSCPEIFWSTILAAMLFFMLSLMPLLIVVTSYQEKRHERHAMKMGYQQKVVDGKTIWTKE